MNNILIISFLVLVFGWGGYMTVTTKCKCSRGDRVKEITSGRKGIVLDESRDCKRLIKFDDNQKSWSYDLEFEVIEGEE